MEEILASIRRIIADDDTSKPAPPPRPAPAPPPVAMEPPEPPAPPSLRMDQSGVDAVMAGLDEQPTPPPAEDVLELTESMTSPEPVPAFQTIDGQPDVVFTDAPPPPPGFVPAGIVVALGHDHLWIGLPFVVIAIAAFEFAVVSAIPLGTQLIAGSPARGVGLMFAAGTFGRASMSLVATRVYSHFGMTWPPLMTAGFGLLVIVAMFRLRAISGRRRSAEPSTPTS